MRKIINFTLLLLALAIYFAAPASAQTKKAANEVKFGFIEKFERTNDGYQIKIDYAEMFEGDAAEREAKRDGEPSPAKSSGIYIRNANPRIHTEKISASATIILLRYLKPYKISLAQLERLMSDETQNLPKIWGFPAYAAGEDQMPCNVTIKNGAIVKIEQVYFP